MFVLAMAVNHRFLSFIFHSGHDPESIVSQLDSRFRGNDVFGIISKEASDSLHGFEIFFHDSQGLPGFGLGK
jgi:hypothetical protein